MHSGYIDTRARPYDPLENYPQTAVGRGFRNEILNRVSPWFFYLNNRNPPARQTAATKRFLDKSWSAFVHTTRMPDTASVIPLHSHRPFRTIQAVILFSPQPQGWQENRNRRKCTTLQNGCCLRNCRDFPKNRRPPARRPQYILTTSGHLHIQIQCRFNTVWSNMTGGSATQLITFADNLEGS